MASLRAMYAKNEDGAEPADAAPAEGQAPAEDEVESVGRSQNPACTSPGAFLADTEYTPTVTPGWTAVDPGPAPDHQFYRGLRQLSAPERPGRPPTGNGSGAQAAPGGQQHQGAWSGDYA